jgi:hypothetical protein
MGIARNLTNAALAGAVACAATALALLATGHGPAPLPGAMRLRASAPQRPLTAASVSDGLLPAPLFAAHPTSRNFAPFEGGNIGRVVRTGANAFTLNLRSDNDDALPRYWRNWFALKLAGVRPGEAATLTLEGAGQWSYYLPVYSYDGTTWRQFSEREVTKPSRYVLRMRKAFTAGTVWLARWVPYTFSTLHAFLERLARRPGVTVASLGASSDGRDVPFVTVHEGDARPIARVFIHARTHPGEVGSSFLVEGLLAYLTGDDPLARLMRRKLAFAVVPMLNVDGVVVGNNRVTPGGVNLEGKWYLTDDDPLRLDAERAPREVQLWHDRIVALLGDGVPPSVALNLHASAGEPEDRMFFFPHFGPKARGYGDDESALYARQIAFIDAVRDVAGKAWLNAPPKDGKRTFLAKAIPETFWWKHRGASVTALTVEAAYGRSPLGRWTTPADLRRLGEALAKAIARVHGLATPALAKRPAGRSGS